MKKRVYILACIGIMVVGASIFLVARLTPLRLNKIERELNNNPNMSSQQLQSFLDEVIAANEILLKDRLERSIRLAKIREKREALQRETAQLMEEKEMLGAELRALEEETGNFSESTESTEIE
jgi:hypothetical protein